MAGTDPPKDARSGPFQADAKGLLDNAAVHDYIAAGLRAHNEAHPGSSIALRRVLLMTDPPLIDRGEFKDRGYINARAARFRHTAAVERVFGDDPAVITAD